MQLKDCQALLTQAFDPTASASQIHRASQMLRPGAQFTPQAQLLIYRHTITGAQQRVLELVYPVCRQILGAACFHTLARDYAWWIGSDCADLNHYGEHFGNWLEQILPMQPALAELAYLPDLARLEWCCAQCLFRADNPHIDFAELGKVISRYGEQLVPQPAPALFLLASPWPVYDVWQAHQSTCSIGQFSLPEEMQYHVIVRQ